MSRPVHLGYFSPSVISAVAHRHGLYRSAGLEVRESPVTSSPQQFRSLQEGEYDLVLTAPDNVATYRFNADNPVGRQLDVRIVAGVDAGTGLALVARPELESVPDLRGRRVAVDVPTSGFALVLYAMLERHGLAAGRDVELVTAGSTPRRWAALKGGEFDATLLNAGFDVVAQEAGHRVLSTVADVASPYLGAVLATMGATLDDRPAEIGAFLTAWGQARAYVLDPANRAEVRDLVADQLSLPPAAAERFYEVLLDPRTGLVPDGGVPREALARVIELRVRQDGFSPPRVAHEILEDASGFVDRRLAPRP